MTRSPAQFTLLAALGSILITGPYTPEAFPEALRFSFAWLGSEMGSERATIEFWSWCSFLLGCSLLLCMVPLLRDSKSKLWLTIPGMLCIASALLQTLPLVAWGFMLLMGTLPSAVPALIHFALLVLCLRAASGLIQKLRSYDRAE
jgi:hypothetical protein